MPEDCISISEDHGSIKALICFTFCFNFPLVATAQRQTRVESCEVRLYYCIKVTSSRISIISKVQQRPNQHFMRRFVVPAIRDSFKKQEFAENAPANLH